MIKKLLFKHQNKTQLYIAVIGSFLGLLFLLISVHYLIRVTEFGAGEEIIGKNTLIIQKKVTNFSSTALGKNDFSTSEINYLKEHDFITQVAPIENNSFGVSLQTDSELVPYFRSDIFVQSFSPEFLDFDAITWGWTEGDEFVPIVLPRDFLVMLNTFASAKGIPQVSEDLAKSIGFKFTLYNDTKKEWQKAKIIGFTSEVSSILIPKEFMDYGNLNFPSNVPSKTTQVLVNIKDGRFGEFQKVMKERSLEAKESAMIVGKLKSIATFLFSVTVGISCFVIFLSGLVFVQYSQLILSKNQYTITTLMRIGTSPKKLVQTISYYFIWLFTAVMISSIIGFIGVKFMIDIALSNSGVAISNNFTLLSFVSVNIVLILYAIITYFNTQREVVKKR